LKGLTTIGEFWFIGNVKMLAFVTNWIVHFFKLLNLSTNFAIWNRKAPKNEVNAQNHKKYDKNKSFFS